MKLLTEIDIPGYPFRIDHRTPLLMLGSCFTENIGRMLERYLFHVSVNPFGVTYNPLSVGRQLHALLHRESYTEEDLQLHDGLWFSFDHYTRFSSPDRREALRNINDSFLGAKQMLPGAGCLVLSFGTAWVYRYRESGEVVCNCHKIPASRFNRTRIGVREITGALEPVFSDFLARNGDLKILLTVSPVRHWKDGAHGNQLSKATLLLACEELQNSFGNRVYYFPSYEIVMDELRDYRFYAGDMLHMSPGAISYIWEKFAASLLSGESAGIIRELEPLLRMMEHRPVMDGGDAYRKFVQKRDAKIEELRARYPWLDWDNLIGT
jgi:hypothetical protein